MAGPVVRVLTWGRCASKASHLCSVQEPQSSLSGSREGACGIEESQTRQTGVGGGRPGRARGSAHPRRGVGRLYTVTPPTSCQAGLRSESHRISLHPCISGQVTAF